MEGIVCGKRLKGRTRYMFIDYINGSGKYMNLKRLAEDRRAWRDTTYKPASGQNTNDDDVLAMLCVNNFSKSIQEMKGPGSVGKKKSLYQVLWGKILKKYRHISSLKFLKGGRVKRSDKKGREKKQISAKIERDVTAFFEDDRNCRILHGKDIVKSEAGRQLVRCLEDDKNNLFNPGSLVLAILTGLAAILGKDGIWGVILSIHKPLRAEPSTFNRRSYIIFKEKIPLCTSG
ncbi:hypothetical protein PR048_024310 [Dryococelus australis]|uniref:Uncharacterized protein n=1 Tax=Dryococelus australis TaxID=614101 RepID=A0ABQ9GN83_9NEOP|nr:hypothetical protein PR048_024310 [Dryococelus australis]